MRLPSSLLALALLLGANTLPTSVHAAPFTNTVERVGTLTFASVEGAGVGGYYPLDRFSQIGGELWFTTERGGTFDVGTISRYNPISWEVEQLVSLDENVGNNLGSNPEGPLLVVGNDAYFTTKNGGTGDNGTVARINLTTLAVTVVHNFSASGTDTGDTPRGGLTLIGDSLFGTTSSGGTNGMGTIFRYNLTSNVVSTVHHFNGAATGRQPYEGFTRVGDAYYFTTFAGGTNSGTGFPNGAGTLGRMTFDLDGLPKVTSVVNLTTGYTAFPAQNPVLVGTNSLYFTTTGGNTAPGAIVRYDLDTGFWTNVFRFTNEATAQALYGKQAGYNGMTEWLGELYFMTRQGGVSNQGVIAKFNIASNTVSKIVDLGGTGANTIGNPSGSYNSGTVVEVTNRFYLYYPVSRGGNVYSGITAGAGTIARVLLPPLPLQVSLAPTNAAGELALSWTGGYLPFSVEACGDVTTGGWTNVLTGLTNRTVVLTNITGQAFFRIGGS